MLSKTTFQLTQTIFVMTACSAIEMKAQLGMKEFIKLDFQILTSLRMIGDSSSVKRDLQIST